VVPDDEAILLDGAVLFGSLDPLVAVPLVQRGWEPFGKGDWKLYKGIPSGGRV
jgi:hypothetical protein